MFSSLSEALRWSANAAVSRVVKQIGDPRQHVRLPFRDLSGRYANVFSRLHRRLLVLARRLGHCATAARSLHRLVLLRGRR